jgi:hypothetical protein
MVVFFLACTKGAFTAVAATAAAPTPAFLRKSRLLILPGSFRFFILPVSFHGFGLTEVQAKLTEYK